MNFCAVSFPHPCTLLPHGTVTGQGDLPILAQVLPFSPPRVGEGAGG